MPPMSFLPFTCHSISLFLDYLLFVSKSLRIYLRLLTDSPDNPSIIKNNKMYTSLTIKSTAFSNRDETAAPSSHFSHCYYHLLSLLNWSTDLLVVISLLSFLYKPILRFSFDSAYQKFFVSTPPTRHRHTQNIPKGSIDKCFSSMFVCLSVCLCKGQLHLYLPFKEDRRNIIKQIV